MQIADGQSAAGFTVRSRLHAILTIELREDELADVGAGRLQRALAHRLRQVRQEAMHDAEYLLCCREVVRDLYAHRSGLRDGRDEEACGDPRGDPDLPRFQ